MKVLFVGWYCPNNCDKPNTGSAARTGQRYYIRWSNAGLPPQTRIKYFEENYTFGCAARDKLPSGANYAVLEVWGEGLLVTKSDDQYAQDEFGNVVNIKLSDPTKPVYTRALDWNGTEYAEVA